MGQQNKNKEFIIRYFNAISGVVKTRKLLKEFTTNEELTNHIAFFYTVFPKYEMFADEITTEDNNEMVRSNCKGCYKGSRKLHAIFFWYSNRCTCNNGCWC